jgi:hypothetical protein
MEGSDNCKIKTHRNGSSGASMVRVQGVEPIFILYHICGGDINVGDERGMFGIDESDQGRY